MYGTPDEIAAKLDTLRAAGIEHVLLNGPAGSRENLRALRPRGDAGVHRDRPSGAAAQPRSRSDLVHKPVSRPSAASRR